MTDPSVAIFIKSYPKDFEWLQYCLRSIQKYVTGYEEIVVAIPEGTSLPLTKERIVHVPEKGNGYYWQMAVKLMADRYTDSHYIMYVDSDCVFTKPFDSDELFDDFSCIKVLTRPWSEAGEGIVWKAPADKALGFDTPWDTMCRHPMMYSRYLLHDLRRHIKALHKKSLEEFVLEEDRFIEFVTAGNFGLKYWSNGYVQVEDSDAYPNPIKQHWSWGGLTPEIREELERIVS